MSIQLGYHIASFNHEISLTELFSAVTAQARAAENAGFDVLTVSDHLYQPPLIGEPDEPILEAYTTLAALAATTTRIQLSAMVTGNLFRNPALLAKIVTTLDVISGGRAVLGIGAGWFELEHRGYGFDFGTAADRADRLEEALRIAVPMLRGGRPTLNGTWYRAENAINEPRLRDDLPVLVGGGGERRTFASAARHADHLNIICNPAELPRKMRALRDRCAEAGRDPETLEVSFATPMMIDEDGDRARKRLRDLVLRSGVDIARLSGTERAAATDRFFVGTPAEVADQIRTKVFAHGVRGLMVNLLADGHEPGVIELAGRTLAPLVRDC
ncbi:probable F420-dependent oxidoreductase, Rv1855c family [Amycolatopsis pretoriensis]|uniref:Probable F420-dependent oxidoreductase, Rv1855c family n=1 Tax=Amycolatopsis pretoriensis TaxID=218821 RepID=A0A1H5QKH1_9PSEU|nr:TIGR03560 family F420-dependent LLM class oxidoreductase [Amycolatopsis pretoriensis]SEF26535.1 probable F420-dependent oxidoreductase, Rv1855c family [Amycolatopsis pretoriensis]